MNSEAVTKTYTHNVEVSPYGSHAFIKKYIKNGDIVLDVGCASGYLGTTCPDNIFYGVDGNAEAVAEAKKVYKDAKLINLNDVPSQPVFEEKFDVIVFADILEHLLYPEDILKHFKYYLKPEGRVVVSLPNIALWRNRINLLLGNFDYTDFGTMDRTHLHLYTFRSAQKLLKDAGFRIVDKKGAAYLFGPIANLNPFFRSLFSVHVIVVGEK
jgi:2-polyprenyl-3-methyl-5-hydroxy-6-metoxy-1,4-benzoquinol methylase